MADDGSIGGNYTMFFWLKNPLQVANGSRYVDVQYLTDGASFLSHRYVCSRCPSVAIANIVALLRGMLHAHALFTYFLISVKGTCVEMTGMLRESACTANFHLFVWYQLASLADLCPKSSPKAGSCPCISQKCMLYSFMAGR